LLGMSSLPFFLAVARGNEWHVATDAMLLAIRFVAMESTCYVSATQLQNDWSGSNVLETRCLSTTENSNY
jgi:hypothetical protein